MKILLVDDDIYSVTALTNLLQYSNTLRVACNGADALEAFKANEYDVVVTDVRMPKMNGLDLLKSIRSFDHKTHVIVVTGHSELSHEAEALEYGADAFFTKPLDVQTFMDILSRFELEKTSSQN